VLREELRKYPRGITEQALLKATLADGADVSRLEAKRAGQWLFAPEAWETIAARATRALQEYHRAHPLRGGMPKEEMKSRLGLQPAVFGAVVVELARAALLAQPGGELALPSHRVEIDPASGGPAGRLLEILGTQPFAPPSLPEAMRDAGASTEVVRALAQRGELVRLSDDVAFTRAAYEAALDVVREVVAVAGAVTVASLRDRMGASRRPVLALLEYLDAQRITRRVGDARVLR
jgi:selenocysteine-specific elongation factor